MPHWVKNMKKNTILTAALLASCTLFSTAAYAVVDISSAPSAIVLTGNGSVAFGDKFKKNNKNAVFFDQFSFINAAVSNVSLIVTSTSTSAANGLNLTGLGLYNDHGLVAKGLQVQTGIDDIWTFSASNLLVGSYYFKVSGDMVSSGGATFAANGRIAAVPEPESYAMLLGGLALLGFMARRRTGVVKAV